MLHAIKARIFVFGNIKPWCGIPHKNLYQNIES